MKSHLAEFAEKNSFSLDNTTFLATYLNGLPCFSEDPDMMLEEFEWLLSLDFPALPNLRLELREVHLDSMDGWFKQAEKDRTSEDYTERIKKSKEKRNEWCKRMIDSTNLSDNISGFILRQAPSDIPKLLELYGKNFVRIATGGDSYDCIACVPRLISAIPGNPQTEVLLGENLSIETFCKAFHVKDPTKVDLPFLLKHLYYQYVRNISAENYREISQSWWDFKKKLMQENPTHYLIDLTSVAEIANPVLDHPRYVGTLRISPPF